MVRKRYIRSHPRRVRYDPGIYIEAGENSEFKTDEESQAIEEWKNLDPITQSVVMPFYGELKLNQEEFEKLESEYHGKILELAEDLKDSKSMSQKNRRRLKREAKEYIEALAVIEDAHATYK